MYRLAALYENPHALWYAGHDNVHPSGLEARMWDVAGVEARAPIDLPQGKCFFSVGEACMHTAIWSESENVQLLLRSCPFGGISHAYADQNTFALDAYGEPLIIASGYSRSHTVDELLAQGALAFLQKPYRLEELSQVLADYMPPEAG